MAASDSHRPHPDSRAPGAPDRVPNFVADLVDDDLRTGKNEGRLHTRFPPEPNGYLHIGHAKSICLNFGLAKKVPHGKCNLRFDDTNPTAEDQEFVDAIQEDVRWLGFAWDGLFFASDYFEQLYEWAEDLIRAGKAYVDDQSTEEIRIGRGNFYQPGKNSPFRDRTVAENLDLFRRMRAGEFPDGARVLRAKIDMAHPNVNLRDPLMYRIRHVRHHRTGNTWCIYPTYDYAHGQSDAIEGITHSICTLEFEDHRPLYDWFLDQIRPRHRPRQIEFARLGLSYTVLSKRVLKQLVNEGIVQGWDDPRMPTLAGMRRRGYPPAAIRNFCDRLAVSKRPGIVDVSLLEHALREELNRTSPRVFAVLRPLKVVIENYPPGQIESFPGLINPEDPSAGTRPLPFSREIFIDHDDFRETPPRNWFRLSPGQEVRLRYACVIRCQQVIKDDAGNVIELRCTWDPESRGGSPKDGRKVRGTLQWLSAAHALPAEVRLYDRLFTAENPMSTENAAADSSYTEDDTSESPSDNAEWRQHLNPESLKIVTGALVEASLANARPGDRYQFERIGYFCVDTGPRAPGAPMVFNRTIGLKDSFSKHDTASTPKS